MGLPEVARRSDEDQQDGRQGRPAAGARGDGREGAETRARLKRRPQLAVLRHDVEGRDDVRVLQRRILASILPAKAWLPAGTPSSTIR
jgi:hypothetical protein